MNQSCICWRTCWYVSNASARCFR